MKINTGLKEQCREKIAHDLAKLLADTYTLYLKTHFFHWNVTGPFFATLHQMFEDQYTELWNAADRIAERIRALGVYAPGSYKQFAKLTSIKEEDSVPSAQDMIKQLVEGHEIVCHTIREMFGYVEESKDEATVDLLTERLDVHEKTAWMLRSMIEK